MRNSRVDTDFGLVADVPVSAPQTHVIQLEATIRSAHALLQAGLIGDATSLTMVVYFLTPLSRSRNNDSC